MPSATIEDYLKRACQLEDRLDGRVPMGLLAESVGVVPGTATAMAKRLARERLMDYEPYEGVRLTARGRHIALRVLRRHRLIETFLVSALGLDWAEVHEEAERLEHAMTDKLLDRIDAFLGYPQRDPHGDPIPDGDGTLRHAALRPLGECDRGESVRITRVLDQSEPFLSFLDERHLRPGTRVQVEQTDSDGDVVTVRAGRHPPVTLGHAAAAKLLVESVR
jgi:DtxR family Mn-dependent transcriptional regulator